MILNFNPHSNLSFKAVHTKNISKSPLSKTNYLNHSSHFFRYRSTDEFLIDYLSKLNQDSINITSAGCSYGEEAYSYAIGLIDKPNVQINAFDISQEAIKGAKKGEYVLSTQEKLYLDPRRFPLKSQNTKEPLQDKIQKDFMKNFKCISWRDYKFQRKHDCLKNCNFFVGDVTKTASYLEKDSQDLILCRYVLYHLDEESREKAVKDFYQTLKPGGLLCFEVDEDFAVDTITMLSCGFIRPFREFPHIWQKSSKPIDREKMILNYQIQKLIEITNK